MPATGRIYLPQARTRHPGEPGPMLGRPWVLASLAAILVATLSPEPDWPGAHGRFFYPIVPATAAAWVDVLQNVALYTPLGFVLAASGRSRWFVCLIAAGVSG